MGVSAELLEENLALKQTLIARDEKIAELLGEIAAPTFWEFTPFSPTEGRLVRQRD